MPQKLEKIRSLRQSLEPLAVLYEKTVLSTCKEAFEVRLTVQQSADHLSEDYYGEDTVHIISGESLQAVHEIWQENRRIERQLLEQSDEKQLRDDLASLSEPEREWLEWFYELSDDDKKIVKDCGEMDVSVTPSNLDQVRDTLEEKDADTWNTVVRLFRS